MQIFKSFFHWLIFGLEKIIEFLILTIGSVFGERNAIIIVYGIYLVVLVSLVYQAIVSFRKKKYGRTIGYLLPAILLFAYWLSVFIACGHKAD